MSQLKNYSKKIAYPKFSLFTDDFTIIKMGREFRCQISESPFTGIIGVAVCHTMDGKLDTPVVSKFASKF